MPRYSKQNNNEDLEKLFSFIIIGVIVYIVYLIYTYIEYVLLGMLVIVVIAIIVTIFMIKSKKNRTLTRADMKKILEERIPNEDIKKQKLQNNKKISKYEKKEEGKNIEYLKAKDLIEYFKITSKELYEILNLLKWAMKSEEKGWRATALGKVKGAKDGIYMGVSYIHWDSKIKNNLEFIAIIKKLKENKKTKNNIKENNVVHSRITNTEKEDVKVRRMSDEEKKSKGCMYELFIAKHYREQGYTISEHGIDNGLKDGGIDIIAKKDMEILFIQCKNWDATKKYKIESRHIKTNRQEVQDYIDDNPIFEIYERKIIYIMSENVLHGSAYHYIQKYHDKVEFKIIPMMN